jgi:hypothetical protein
MQLKSFKQGDMVTSLTLECIANREKEGLYVDLKPVNCKIELVEGGLNG